MALLHPEQDIRGTYEVEKFLGEGAFAEVYRVKHRFLGRQAMKVFKRTGITLEKIEEMLGEAIMLSKIGHPNIIRVFDANIVETDKGLCGFFTMEYVPGGSLDKFWHSFGDEFVPVETTVDIIKQVCRGISLAQKENPPVIHRDIKPQNILVGYQTEGLRARVSDFGLAKSVNPLTLLATAAGTLAFKPPEAFSEEKGDSAAGDVWAIGVTLYLLLTDQLPFKVSGEWGFETRSVFNDDIIPASKFNPDVNKALDRIIGRALTNHSNSRIPTATDLLAELDAWKPGKAKSMQNLGGTADASKSVLGIMTNADKESGDNLAKEALSFRKKGHLEDAADRMEEAFNKWPDLRVKYANQVRLWRCGISM